MTEKIVNLTSILVTREVHSFLTTYPPEDLYRIIFSLPFFKQRLIATILSAIPNRHVVTEDFQTMPTQEDDLLASLEEQLEIESLIKKFIPEVLVSSYPHIGEELIEKEQLLREGKEKIPTLT